MMANQHVIVMGAGESGRAWVRQHSAESLSLDIIGYLDDNEVRIGSVVGGLSVLGASHSLETLMETHRIDKLVVAMPSAAASRIGELTAMAVQLGLAVEVISSYGTAIADILLHNASITPASEPQLKSSTRRSTHDFDLAVVGLGYVGMPVAVEAALAGMKVLGVDIDQRVVEHLRKGVSHIEDVDDSQLSEAIAAGLVVTTDSDLLSNAAAVCISVPTPLKNNLPDLTAVISATSMVGSALSAGQLVILESTTYPGTTEEIVQPILEEKSGLKSGVDFELAYSPERIDPANGIWTLKNTPKLVGGCSARATTQAAEMYSRFCEEIVELSGTREAEMAKILENTYRHVNIALVNEMMIFCGPLGVDIWEAIRGAATKPFGFEPFYPGPGVGGHCIPIDPGYLSYRVRELGEQFRFVELATEVNSYMPEHVCNRVEGILGDAGRMLEGCKIVIIGVAYKPDVADVRETPASAVVRLLRARMVEVAYIDGRVEQFEVDERPVERLSSLRDIPPATALLILHTAHKDLDLDEVSSMGVPVLDTRAVMPRDKAFRL